MREVNTALYNAFGYDQTTTDVDSQIDHVLSTRRGVCQDFVHVMLALLRGIGIPCRYVSGYLFHREKEEEKDHSAADATHAWAEVWLPRIGW